MHSVIYCAYFDANYLVRGIAMCGSLLRHLPSSKMLVLCLDDRSYRTMTLLAMRGVSLLDRKGFERRFPVPASLRNDPRAVMTSYKPLLLKLAMEQHSSAGFVAHLDADLYFWSDASALEREITSASVLLSPHRLSPSDGHLRQYGHYNGGLIAFRRDPDGVNALNWWCERVLERCEEDLAHGFNYDQLYLERIPQLFGNVSDLRHPGINLAPWNLANHDLEIHAGSVTVDGTPLVCYHFHGLNRLAPRLYDTGLTAYFHGSCAALKRTLYVPYIARLRQIQHASNAGTLSLPFGVSNVRYLARDPACVAWLKALRRPRSLLLLPSLPDSLLKEATTLPLHPPI